MKNKTYSPVEKFNAYASKINSYIRDLQRAQLSEDDPMHTKLKKLAAIQKRIRSIQTDLDAAYSLLPENAVPESGCTPSLIIEALENHIYHYQLLKPLPHQIKYDENARQQMYWYEKNRTAGEYAAAYQQFVKDHSFVPYKEPVVAWFVFSINDSFVLPDMDNIDVKPFIDTLISHVLIPDDKGRHLHLFLTAEEKEGYGDVYVGTLHDIMHYLHI